MKIRMIMRLWGWSTANIDHTYHHLLLHLSASHNTWWWLSWISLCMSMMMMAKPLPPPVSLIIRITHIPMLIWMMTAMIYDHRMIIILLTPLFTSLRVIFLWGYARLNWQFRPSSIFYICHLRHCHHYHCHHHHRHHHHSHHLPPATLELPSTKVSPCLFGISLHKSIICGSKVYTFWSSFTMPCSPCHTEVGHIDDWQV